MKFKLILTSILLLFMCTPCYPNDKEDIAKLQKEISTTSGKEKLKAYAAICNLLEAQPDSAIEIKYLNEYFEEANNQGNYERACEALSKKMFCYYNFDMTEPLESEMPKTLEYMAKHNQFNCYYNAWQLLVEQRSYMKQFHTALDVANQIYKDAKQRKSNYGLGISCFCLGEIYSTLQRFDIAEKSLKESIQYLKTEEDVSILLSAYNSLCEVLQSNNKNNEIITTANDWRSVIDKYSQKAKKRGYTVNLDGRYLLCTLAQLNAECALKNYPKAKQLLDEAEGLAKGRKSISQIKLLQAQTSYYAAIGDYQKALKYNSDNIEILKNFDDSVSIISANEKRAEILMNMHNYQEASLVYQDIINQNKELADRNLNSQLGELSTIYKVDKLNEERHNNRIRLILISIIALVLIGALCTAIIYNLRLRKSYKTIYNTLSELNQQKATINEFVNRIPQENLTKEEVLYRRLCQLMDDEELFKTSINRNELAKLLGTNTTYLSNAISKCDNSRSVSEFINNYRLKYASTLLIEKMDMSVNEIGDLAGFTSRSTFFRTFKEYYSMSPLEYRKMASLSMAVENN